MQFIRVENLKNGMRLARPIYSKKGVLLYERNSLLTPQAIESAKNFGLLGIYILEPAEPLPPISEDDLEYEKFQIVTVASIQEELDAIISKKKQAKLQTIVSNIVRQYRGVDEKINFYQNLRSKDDYVARHALNVAVLCILMCKRLNLKAEDTNNTLMAAIVHDLGKVLSPLEFMYNLDLDEDQRALLYGKQMGGMELIEQALGLDGVPIRRICSQALKCQMDAENGDTLSNPKSLLSARILHVANRYDELTAMSLDGKSESEVKAIQEFLDRPGIYDEKVVQALIEAVNIIIPGLSVELSTGRKALVLNENDRDILRPTVLTFGDNSIIDLSLKVNKEIRIVDIMKTLDNRVIISKNPLAGASAEASADQNS
ncbi:MAG: HD domain-containing protein [Lachnospiraceae bacterium]|nr:HD domain-containing protein [Lachnospiraceae bacterium]